MLRDVDNYFHSQQEPIKGCLLALRTLILDFDHDVTEVWRYSMPFYCYKGKRFCYLWVHKKFKQPYLGIVNGAKVNHPDLIKEKRSRMKILLIDPKKDIPLKKLEVLLTTARESV